MSKVKVIEVDAIKLNKDAKYIFLISPMYSEDAQEHYRELDRLVGEDRYTLFYMNKERFTALEVLPPDQTKETEE
jgi:hypothetical protein